MFICFEIRQELCFSFVGQLTQAWPNLNMLLPDVSKCCIILLELHIFWSRKLWLPKSTNLILMYSVWWRTGATLVEYLICTPGNSCRNLERCDTTSSLQCMTYAFKVKSVLQGHTVIHGILGVFWHIFSKRSSLHFHENVPLFITT